jgi:ligand-binding sensor domain-containing protein
MKLNNRRFVILVWLFLFAVQACTPSKIIQSPVTEPDPVFAPTPEPTETPPSILVDIPTATPIIEPDIIEFIDLLPINLGDGQVLLWAGGASASTSAGMEGYHAKQALGKPNTLACGRFVTAWQPVEDETEAWIELYYAPYILPNLIYIEQSYLPKQLSKVEVVTLDGETISVFDRDADDLYQPDECPATRALSLPDVEALISIVRITLEREDDEEWTQIDAVGVVGLIGDFPTEPMETNDWADDDYVDEDDGFYTPRYYTNKNSINALTFTGDKLWMARDGGVVSWDLDTLNPTAYTAAHGLPANATRAIAYCDWEYGEIVTGGSAGIAILFEDDFYPIEHSDDKTLGPVTALACDVVRDQIWVGYLGHMGRYDLSTQSWTVFGEREGMPMDVVRQIKIIGQEVWAATAYGVAVVRRDDRLISFTPDNSGIPAQFVHAIAADEVGILWMASSSGLLEFDGQTWTLWESSDIGGGPLLNMLMDIDVDDSGSLWIADTYGTLCQFDTGEKVCKQTIQPPDDELVLGDFAVAANGRMALGDYRTGTWFVLGNEWFKLSTRDQLVDNALNAIAYAPDGNLWLAGKGEVQYFSVNNPGKPWDKLSLPQNAQANAFCVTSDGLWIGHTQGARFLPYLDQNTLDLPIGDTKTAIVNSVTAISVDPSGRVYFGTSSGLSIWDGSRFQYEDLLTSEERSKSTYPPRVNVLFADENTVWVGASNGLFEFDDGRLVAPWRDTLLELEKNTPSIGVLIASPDGNGLLVGAGRYLYQFEDGAFELVLELPSEIRSVYTMPYALMLATAHSGLFSLPKDDFGIYWDWVSVGGGFARCFGSQAITMSDMHTLWIASCEGGLQRTQALFNQ